MSPEWTPALEDEKVHKDFVEEVVVAALQSRPE